MSREFTPPARRLGLYSAIVTELLIVIYAAVCIQVAIRRLRGRHHCLGYLLSAVGPLRRAGIQRQPPGRLDPVVVDRLRRAVGFPFLTGPRARRLAATAASAICLLPHRAGAALANCWPVTPSNADRRPARIHSACWRGPPADSWVAANRLTRRVGSYKTAVA